GQLVLTNSMLTVDNGIPAIGMSTGGEVDFNSDVSVNNSTINTSNVMYTIVGGGNFGPSAPGNLGMTNSTLIAHNFYVAYLDDSTATLSNSYVWLGDGLTVGGATEATGNVAILGGQFIATNTIFGPGQNVVALGVYGTANLLVSNAYVEF